MSQYRPPLLTLRRRKGSSSIINL
uniref:Uncharacterized protein n=1 Tax=Anguilla anguilla TaxID=7936 RepID=A0A0E9WDC4_ANGAN